MQPTTAIHLLTTQKRPAAGRLRAAFGDTSKLFGVPSLSEIPSHQGSPRQSPGRTAVRDSRVPSPSLGHKTDDGAMNDGGLDFWSFRRNRWRSGDLRYTVSVLKGRLISRVPGRTVFKLRIALQSNCVIHSLAATQDERVTCVKVKARPLDRERAAARSARVAPNRSRGAVLRNVSGPRTPRRRPVLNPIVSSSQRGTTSKILSFCASGTSVAIVGNRWRA